jgi:uncharacterized protein
MVRYDTLLSGLLLAIGIMMGAYFISTSLNNHTYYNRSIHVKGLSEKDVVADVGTLTLTISLAGNEAILLSQKAEEAKHLVLNGLIKAGFKESEIKSDLPVAIEDKMLDRYNDRFDPAKQARYILETSIQLETQDVEKLFKSTHVINQFVAQGIIFKGATSPAFFYTKLNDIKPAMLKEAGESAHAAAIELAKNTKSQIGKIKDASQGAFSIRLRNDNSEYDSGYGKSSPYLRARVVTNVTYFIAD